MNGKQASTPNKMILASEFARPPGSQEMAYYGIHKTSKQPRMQYLEKPAVHILGRKKDQEEEHCGHHSKAITGLRGMVLKQVVDVKEGIGP